MFDIGFSELLLVFIIGLVVLGPQRLPVAVKTVAGWVAENQTALLYLMTREQRAVRHQGESDMAGSRWYWRTIPLNTGNALLQAVDIEVTLHEDFSSVIQSRRAWFSAVGGQQ